ncbi:MAG: HNH endonuclease signature motif containing protein, partial [Spirochaetaceae bacterium]|nr:HNH endonuclease signature motif containing protein [Spirochaetaceae bacterium]
TLTSYHLPVSLALSAPKRHAQTEHGGTMSAAARQIVRRTDSAAQGPSEAGHGSASLVAPPGSGAYATPAAKRQSEAEPGRASGAVAQDGGGWATSAAKRVGEDKGAHVDEAARLGADAARAPERGGGRFPTSAPKRFAYGDGLDAKGTTVRSPALERHLAALRCVGAVPGSQSRYIPAAVRREVWRRDEGCCSYVDPHSGRRCGSRYRLEVDHIVPFARGGTSEPSNLRVRCGAHHGLRHAQCPRPPHESAE